MTTSDDHPHTSWSDVRGRRLPDDAAESEPHVTQRHWRVGMSWGLTIVADGDGEPDERGRRDGDKLVALGLDEKTARHIVDAHNVMWSLLHNRVPVDGGDDAEPVQP